MTHIKAIQHVHHFEFDFGLTIINLTVMCKLFSALRVDRRMKIKEIAQAVKISQKHRSLEKHLQLLSAAGLAHGLPGPSGGYMKAQPNATVGGIVRAIWGDLDNPLVKAWDNIRPGEV